MQRRRDLSSQGSLRTSFALSTTIFALVMVGRAAFVFPIANTANCFHNRNSEKITYRQQFISWWAGLMRGAVTIALSYNQYTVSGSSTSEKGARMITSTIIVVLFSTMVQYRQMAPDAAYEYVKSIRPRVLLAPAQRQAVEEFYCLRVKSTTRSSQPSMSTLSTADEVSVHSLISHTSKNVEAFDKNSKLVVKGVDSSHFVFETPESCTRQDISAFDESSVVLITESDLDGYDGSDESGTEGNEICAEVSIIYRVQFASQAVLARLSGLRLRYIYARHKMSGEKLGRDSSCSVGADKFGGLGVDIHVY